MGISNAQDQPPAPDQKKERMNQGNECANPEDCPSESRRERRARDRDDDDSAGSTAQDQDSQRYRDRDNNRREARQGKWRYDSRHHRRSKNRDATFRFYFGGYYYPERYWDAPVIVIGNRVSCREGREIVDDSGFNRVRTVECSGRNYTYTGRRHGDTFRIVLNSRNGRIVSVREF
jgi:hypothetical protein